MIHRIVEVRKARKLNQGQFAEKLGLSRSFINQVETGKKNISDRTIADICRCFHINEKWLRTGEGEMEISPSEAMSPLQEFFENNSCTDMEIKFLTAFFNLEEKDRNNFCETLMKMFPQAISDHDEDYYAEYARRQRLLEKERDVQASSVKESDAG